jgi:hypothetical protein
MAARVTRRINRGWWFEPLPVDPEREGEAAERLSAGSQTGLEAVTLPH